MTSADPTPDSTPPRDDDARPVLVIGATGKTGRRVVDLLTAAGSAVRPASRSSVTRFDWHSPDTWAPALAGSRAAYVVPPDEPADIDRFLADAAAADVQRLVLLSARHPDQGGDGLIPAIEAAVHAGPIPATVIQPSWFSQNFTEGIFADELGSGVLHLPVGDGKEPFIDAGDIAAVAAAALLDERHVGATYELSGPELLTFDDAVARLSRVTGRDLRFVPVEPGEWADSVAAFLPPPVVELLLNLFSAIRNGDNDHLSTGVEQALGRPARSFEEALALDDSPTRS